MVTAGYILLRGVLDVQWTAAAVMLLCAFSSRRLFLSIQFYHQLVTCQTASEAWC